MICFEHSELCYKQLLETQLLLGNELPVNNQQTILKSRFYKNNTTAEIACAETVITKLGMNSSYIHFVSFFKLQYSKKDVELIFSYLTTLPLLVHIITDVDKTVWKNLFVHNQLLNVKEYFKMHCVAGSITKVYYLQLNNQAYQKSVKSYPANTFPNCNDGAICFDNMKTELSNEDTNILMSQLQTILKIIEDSTKKRAAKEDGKKKKSPKSVPNKRKKKYKLNKQQETEITKILVSENKQINDLVVNLITMIKNKPVLKTASTDALFAQIVKTFGKAFNDKVSKRDQLPTVGAKRKIDYDNDDDDDDDASLVAEDASTESDKKPKVNIDDDDDDDDDDDNDEAIVKSLPLAKVDSKSITKTAPTTSKEDIQKKLLAVRKKDRKVDEKCGGSYCMECTDLFKCPNCDEYFCDIPSNLHYSKHLPSCNITSTVTKQCKMQSSTCDNKLTYCKSCKSWVCTKHKSKGWHLCGTDTTPLINRKGDDSDDDSVDDNDRNKKTDSNKKRKVSNIAEYKTPDKSSKAKTNNKKTKSSEGTMATTSKIVAHEGYTITDQEYTTIAALVTMMQILALI
jgi:hypothetical protein